MVGTSRLEVDRWHDISLKWNLAVPQCEILIDGTRAGTLKVRHGTLNGISYVRFRSVAEHIDTHGFLVDRVTVSIDDPYAPRCSPRDQAEHEQRYVEKVVPLWQRES